MNEDEEYQQKALRKLIRENDYLRQELESYKLEELDREGELVISLTPEELTALYQAACGYTVRVARPNKEALRSALSKLIAAGLPPSSPETLEIFKKVSRPSLSRAAPPRGRMV